MILLTWGCRSMTKWIRLSNAGSFDVVTAVGMLGASVKTCDDPIGLYGSGIKYALAQCLRHNISLKISDNGKLYTLVAKPEEFRGETFNKVALKTKTGKMHVTGITSDFGKEDWNENWFIFREFFSNMLDEKGTWEIVDSVEVNETGVDVFLPYAVFSEFIDNLEDYFTDPDWSCRIGTGRVFKKGVWVGEFGEDNNPGLDIQSPYVQITETRTMDIYYAWRRFSSILERVKDVELLSAFFSHPNCWPHVHSVWFNKVKTDDVSHVHTALLNTFGDDYVVCPNVDWIIKDAEQVLGKNPIVLSEEWTLPEDVQTMDSISDTIIFRDATEDELCILEKGMKALSWMDDISNATGNKLADINIRVLKTDNNTGGLAKQGTTQIAINQDVISGDYTSFVKTLLHEIVHIFTGEGDYTRGFAGYMERALAEMSV